MDILSLTKQAKIDNEEKQSLQQVVLGKLDSYVQKNEMRTLYNTIQKNKLKMYSKSKCKTGNIKLLEESIDRTLT